MHVYIYIQLYTDVHYVHICNTNLKPCPVFAPAELCGRGERRGAATRDRTTGGGCAPEPQKLEENHR